jgi:hypothetical protein
MIETFTTVIHHHDYHLGDIPEWLQIDGCITELTFLPAESLEYGHHNCGVYSVRRGSHREMWALWASERGAEFTPEIETFKGNLV